MQKLTPGRITAGVLMAFTLNREEVQADPDIVVLIDGDVLAYQASYGREAPVYVETELDAIMDRILEDTRAASYIVYLTGDDNFRDSVAMIQQYKGNRYFPDGSRKKPQPELLPLARKILIDKYNAELQHGQEADDALVIMSTMLQTMKADGVSTLTPIISTIDKDLRICPGLHHNIGNSTVTGVSKFGCIYMGGSKGTELKGEGLKFFFAQLLMGDPTDHIPGLPYVTPYMKAKYNTRLGGVGAVAAFRVLETATTPEECFHRVHCCYISYWHDPDGKHPVKAENWRTGAAIDSSAIARLTEQGQLLWMRTKPGEMWTPPHEWLEYSLALLTEAEDE